ncbi:hypothetical protein I4U23_001959 [Adineta vaga]|nr:hypothetical protein I4U23_001959 [Adineta vaga]
MNSEGKHFEPIFLNVYDLLFEYRKTHCLITSCTCHRFGIYHTSVQMYGIEYYYGNGICKCQPYSHVGRLISSKQIGATELTREEIERKILFDMSDNFTQKDYDLLRHNCNHFTNSFLRLFIPCCTRSLRCIFGNDWTKPLTMNSSTLNHENKTCCHRISRK